MKAVAFVPEKEAVISPEYLSNTWDHKQIKATKKHIPQIYGIIPAVQTLTLSLSRRAQGPCYFRHGTMQPHTPPCLPCRPWVMLQSKKDQQKHVRYFSSSSYRLRDKPDCQNPSRIDRKLRGQHNLLSLSPGKVQAQHTIETYPAFFRKILKRQNRFPLFWHRYNPSKEPYVAGSTLSGAIPGKANSMSRATLHATITSISTTSTTLGTSAGLEDLSFRLSCAEGPKRHEHVHKRPGKIINAPKGECLPKPSVLKLQILSTTVVFAVLRHCWVRKPVPNLSPYLLPLSVSSYIIIIQFFLNLILCYLFLYLFQSILSCLRLPYDRIYDIK